MTTRILVALVAALGLSTVAGCRGQTSEEPPIVPIRNMYDQPRYDPQQRSKFFEDERTMRPLVDGVVSREMEVDLTVASGRTDDDTAWVDSVPDSVIEGFEGGMQGALARGQQRFNIYCAPCHGEAGDGEGIVARRATYLGAAALKPPTFHDDRLRTVPDGQIFATISNGIRNMPPYKHAIAPKDRWAIVTYLRALQLSQLGRATASNDTPTMQAPSAASGNEEATR